MRVLLTKWFQRFAERERITHDSLRESIQRAERGLIDADLGGGVIKQRISRLNEGKSGGFRTIILYRAEQRAFFVYGFSKGERENIKKSELNDLRQLAILMLNQEVSELESAIEESKLVEVTYEQDIQE